MKILLACSAGMSTSLLELSLNEYMKTHKIKGLAAAYSSEAAKERIEEFDVILLGPQVRFMAESFRELTKKPVGIIKPADYAMANAENVFKYAEELLKK